MTGRRGALKPTSLQAERSDYILMLAYEHKQKFLSVQSIIDKNSKMIWIQIPEKNWGGRALCKLRDMAIMIPNI